MAYPSGYVGTAQRVVAYFKVVAQDGTGDYNGSDDTPISSALADLATAGGGTLIIKNGTYNLSTGFNLTSDHDNVHIVGEGFATILKLDASTNDQIFDLNGCTNVHIGNMKLDGNGANQTSGWGIIAVGSTECRFEDLWFYQTRRGAISIEQSSSRCFAIRCKGEDKQDAANTADMFIINASSHCGFIECFADTSAHSSDNGFGVYTSGAASGCVGNHVLGCTSTAAGDNGFNIEGAGDTILKGCVAYSNTNSGIAVNDTSTDGVVISDCVTYSNTKDGIVINAGLNISIENTITRGNSDDGIYVGTDASYVTIKGCVVHNNQDYGIRVYDAVKVSIIGCTIYDNDQAAGNLAGIRIDSSTYTLITGNNVFNTGATKQYYNIYLYDTCTYSVISNNVCEDSGDHNIFMNNVSRCVITGNQAEGGADTGIKTSGTSDYNIVNANHVLNNTTAQINLANANNVSTDNITA